MKIAIQGIKGAFHEVAARKFFGSDIEVHECLTFQDLCNALDNNEVQKAVMAIENTIAGSLLPNYALIQKHRFRVVGEVFLNINMNLMTIPGVELSEVNIVESHPIALLQCKEFLYANLNADHKESNDTAESAYNLSVSQDENTAVIAAERCADLYGLEIKEKGIETNKQNFTRFLILSKIPEVVIDANKASLSIQLGHSVGSLAEVLQVFKNSGINLTKIQSVPIIGAPYEYNFHIDIEWNERSDYERGISEVAKLASSFSLLGEYKKSTFALNM